ncbi:MAG: M28 family peptidase [Planctomycetales bacterium]|nr:M28 family peptidase [Planctomycetales bacterium]
MPRQHDELNTGNLAAARRQDRLWWLCLATYLLFGVIARIQYRGPSSTSQDNQQIAQRTLDRLSLLLSPEQNSHPGGSSENVLFQQRLTKQLTDLGLEATAMPFETDEVAMSNIIARVPGRAGRHPIVFATHYDSCRFGPGAADAGVCVASLVEMAAELMTWQDRSECWLIFTDGEERPQDNAEGLRGAIALLAGEQTENLPWGDKVPFVVSLDARGNRGCALLYETDIHNLASMQLATRILPRPLVTSSLMVNVYRQLPNGTDFTVYKNAGWSGWNFALIDGTEHYHQPSDTIENLSQGSAIHFAKIAIAAARGLSELDDQQLDRVFNSTPATFFDLLGQLIVIYPASWDKWLLLVGIVLFAVCLQAAAKRTGGSVARELRQLVFLLLQMAVQVALLSAVGYLLSKFMQVSGLLPRRFVPGGEWLAQVYLFAPSLWMCIWAKYRLVNVPTSTFLLAFSAASLLLAGLMLWLLPGGAYLAIVGGIWFGIHSYFSRHLPTAGGVILQSLLPALLLAPTFVLLVLALGPAAGGPITLVASLILLPTLAAFAGQPAGNIDPKRLH